MEEKGFINASDFIAFDDYLSLPGAQRIAVRAQTSRVSKTLEVFSTIDC
jgi:hypothetical protein